MYNICMYIDIDVKACTGIVHVYIHERNLYMLSRRATIYNLLTYRRATIRIGGGLPGVFFK